MFFQIYLKQISIQGLFDGIILPNLFQKCVILAGINLLKVDDRNIRTRCEICSKLTIKTQEQRPGTTHFLKQVC